jgi:hypothetical protein
MKITGIMTTWNAIENGYPFISTNILPCLPKIMGGLAGLRKYEVREELYDTDWMDKIWRTK